MPSNIPTVNSWHHAIWKLIVAQRRKDNKRKSILVNITVNTKNKFSEISHAIGSGNRFKFRNENHFEFAVANNV